jgi:hypothetical protein
MPKHSQTEQGAEHVKFEVWTKLKENNKSKGKFIFFHLDKILKMVNLSLVKVHSALCGTQTVQMQTCLSNRALK